MFLLDFYRKKREQTLYRRLGKCGRNVFIGFPVFLANPKLLYMDDFSRIMNGANLILDTGKFIVGKYSVLASRLTVITDNHTPTVGVPYYFTGSTHINDRTKDVIIKEDCWVGANVTLLPGVLLSRGVVVAAGSIVNKEIPPYAVVAGIPAKIIAVKFSIDEILEHEKHLYEEKERMSKESLEELFNTVFKDKKIATHAHLSDDNIEQLKRRMPEFGIKYIGTNWYDL